MMVIQYTGPFGYSDPDNINSELKIVTSSYVTDINRVTNRPLDFLQDFL